jgi:choline-sulfatase
MPTERPNILFLMSDEHRADVAGFAGDDVIRTPVLDELARTGAVFTNAYTPSPICIPGRQAMMAGQFPRHCGCERFGEDLAPGYMTFARRLSQYGYRTACFGKLHHVGPDQMQGWQTRPVGDMHLDSRYIERQDGIESPRGVPQKWSDAKEIQRAGVGNSPYAVLDEYWTLGAEHWVRERYLNAFYDREDTTTPTLLKLSLLQPHYPYICQSEAQFGYYLNRVRPYVNETPFDHPFLGQRQLRIGADVTEREVRRATAAYYAMIETLDGHYGSLMEALRHVGQDLDDWVIVYTSDHGEMLGQHGIWEKQKFFEASARVPLIIRWPRRFTPRVVTENVNLCDLFATFCDLAGIPTPDGLDSRSLVPLLEGRSDGWDNETVSQFGGRNLMIKRDALKYQWYGPDMPEVLFNLATDPDETRNVISDAAYTDAVTRFRQRRDELGFAPV